MSKDNDRISHLSEEQLEEEARKIDEVIRQDPLLLNVHVTKEMDERMMRRIREIQKQKS